MRTTLLSLLGLALFGALFAGIYYAPSVEEVHTVRPTFGLAPGDARPDFIEPGVAGTNVTVDIVIIGGPIDVYFMDQEWLGSLIEPGQSRFNMSQPFNYHSQWTRIGVDGNQSWEIEATGETRLAMVFDYTDTYYEDTAPGDEPAFVAVSTRYIEQETKSLVYGYLAAIPSVLLVGFTVGKKVYKHRLSVSRTRP